MEGGTASAQPQAWGESVPSRGLPPPHREWDVRGVGIRGKLRGHRGLGVADPGGSPEAAGWQRWARLRPAWGRVWAPAGQRAVGTRRVGRLGGGPSSPAPPRPLPFFCPAAQSFAFSWRRGSAAERREGEREPGPEPAGSLPRLPSHGPHGSRSNLGRAGGRTAALGRGPRRARPGGCLARPAGRARLSCPPGLAPTPGSPRPRFRGAETGVRGSG